LPIHCETRKGVVAVFGACKINRERLDNITQCVILNLMLHETLNSMIKSGGAWLCMKRSHGPLTALISRKDDEYGRSNITKIRSANSIG